MLKPAGVVVGKGIEEGANEHSAGSGAPAAAEEKESKPLSNVSARSAVL